MNSTQIRALQSRLGVVVDGFWGQKSIAAAQKHLRSLMPDPHPFPKPNTPAFHQFYGPHGEPDGYTPPCRSITLPFTIYYESRSVTRLTVHEKCADSLLAVFQRLATTYPDRASREAAGILVYDGLYNPRRMRGGTSWSMHSWACAIDLNAGRNGLKTAWPVTATMPFEVMECFAAEGWLAAGAFWGRDAMHFQATA